MIVKRISTASPLCPIYPMSEALKIGPKKLLLTSPFGKAFIMDEYRMLLGYYSAEHYKNTGRFDMQYDTVYLQEDDVDAQSKDISIPLSVEEEGYDILPIVSAKGKVAGAVICTDEAWQNDKNDCLKTLEYLSDKGMSLEYWFLTKNYKKVVFWGLDNLSLAFANEIRHYHGIELLGIYEQNRRKSIVISDYFNYSTEVKFVETIEDLAEADADLIIITDWTMRHLTNSPLLNNLHTDTIYAPKILKMNTPVDLYHAQNNKNLLNDDVKRCVHTELYNRYKAKYRALGCNFLTVAIPDNDDLGICKDFTMSNENISRWVAERNGWEPEGNEINDYMRSRSSLIKNIIKNGDKMYLGDCRSRYINYVNKSRVVLNAPASYKNTVYLVGTCIVGSIYCIDEESLGYYLQENINNCGLEYRVVPIMEMLEFDRYYHVTILEEYDIKEGDKIFLLDSKIMQIEWDLDLTLVYKELCKQYGDDVFMDRPIHCAKEGTKAVADFLVEHLNDPFASDTHAVNLTAFSGNPQLKKYQEFIQSNSIHKTPKIGSIVMNCNPFTLGHRHLIEYAAVQVDYLYIFVVQEDKSLFKFEDRIKLVEAGTSHLENVKVLPSGQFVISSLTFSEYFDKENWNGTKVDTSLDLATFGSQIAPCLNISVRFVGEEPLDPVTALYNRNMKEILPKYGIELCEIPRREIDGEVISASRVRKCLEEKNWEEIRKLVPETTYSFLEANYSTD